MLETLEFDIDAKYATGSSSLKRIAKQAATSGAKLSWSGTISEVEPILYLSAGPGRSPGDVRVPGFRQINIFLIATWLGADDPDHYRAALQVAWHAPLAEDAEQQEGAAFDTGWYATRNVPIRTTQKVTEVYAWLKSL